MATSTTNLGTSNLRGPSRQTRINSSRALRTNRPNLRQNSLISNPTASAPGASEPQGFYPAVTSFTDAIAALPRDYRRHTSLLKEVDAKAWFPEESLQKLLAQCLVERQTRPISSTTNTIAGSMNNVLDTVMPFSGSNSINGMALDNISQHSSQSVDPSLLQRRQLYAALRHNLMQMMVTMDEKNHVINNANEDLSRHIRRLDNVWPHLTEEISEEARLGSLKHWAYTETNPVVKKAAGTSARREAGAAIAMLADNDIAHRSESRREAMLAKKQRMNQQLDSDFDERVGRRGVAGTKNRRPEAIADITPLNATGTGKRKTAKGPGGVPMERTVSSRTGGTAMSREPSQQDNIKKRKAPMTAGTNARKRLHPNIQDSPKLASSPLALTSGKEPVKRSPALSSARPVARARQNSAQNDNVRARPSSSMARNSSGIQNSDLGIVAAATGRTASEIRASMKETTNSRGDALIEGRPINGESIRGAILLERTTSRQGHLKKEAAEEKAAASPRLSAATTTHEVKASRSRASKTSTPIVGTFEEGEADSISFGNGGENGIGAGNKPKRAPRARMKDHHGLQDSLSPKGLPIKRTHNKTSSFSSLSAMPITGKSSSSRARDRDRVVDNEDSTAPPSRTTSRNNHNTNASTPTDSQAPTTQDARSSDEEQIEADADEDELRYCYCDGVSYGEMVACDNKNCPREWFHLECIGLKSSPKSAKWYCDECKENLAKRGRFGSTGGAV